MASKPEIPGPVPTPRRGDNRPVLRKTRCTAGERLIVPNVSSAGQRSKLSAAELGLGPVFIKSDVVNSTAGSDKRLNGPSRRPTMSLAPTAVQNSSTDPAEFGGLDYYSFNTRMQRFNILPYCRYFGSCPS